MRPSTSQLLVLLGAFITANPVPGSGQIVAGPFVCPINGHSYYLTGPMTWQQAQGLANTMEGRLATVRSASENQWLVDAFHPLVTTGMGAYIGLNDARQEGAWQWADGVPLSHTGYANWGPDEPNNLSNEDWAEILLGPFHIHSIGEWNDIRGEQQAIIEIPRPAPDYCRDCNDGLFCNGLEYCVEGECVSSGDPCLLSGLTCNEDADRCECNDDEQCDDGVFCNGAELCVNDECIRGEEPCPDRGCQERGQVCVSWCRKDAECDDGDPCTVDICMLGGRTMGQCTNNFLTGCSDSNDLTTGTEGSETGHAMEPEATGLAIRGPAEVEVGEDVRLVAELEYDDGSTTDVSVQVFWSVLTPESLVPSFAAHVSPSGVLTPGLHVFSPTAVIVEAQFEMDHIWEATHYVSIYPAEIPPQEESPPDEITPRPATGLCGIGIGTPGLLILTTLMVSRLNHAQLLYRTRRCTHKGKVRRP